MRPYSPLVRLWERGTQLIRVQPLGTESLEQARFFRAQLQQGKHALLPSPHLSPSLPPRRRGGYGVRKGRFRRLLKPMLQHFKSVGARLPSLTLWERGWG
jgi:hypothetical protein